MTNRVDIHYCTGCRWLMRSAWMAQELLTTFEGELDELTLHPGSGGIFEIWVNGGRGSNRQASRRSSSSSNWSGMKSVHNGISVTPTKRPEELV